jgi:hypothetical protein
VTWLRLPIALAEDLYLQLGIDALGVRRLARINGSTACSQAPCWRSASGERCSQQGVVVLRDQHLFPGYDAGVPPDRAALDPAHPHLRQAAQKRDRVVGGAGEGEATTTGGVAPAALLTFAEIARVRKAMIPGEW